MSMFCCLKPHGYIESSASLIRPCLGNHTKARKTMRKPTTRCSTGCRAGRAWAGNRCHIFQWSLLRPGRRHGPNATLLSIKPYDKIGGGNQQLPIQPPVTLKLQILEFSLCCQESILEWDLCSFQVLYHVAVSGSQKFKGSKSKNCNQILRHSAQWAAWGTFDDPRFASKSALITGSRAANVAIHNILWAFSQVSTSVY